VTRTPTTGVPGQVLTYTITATNVGTQDSSGASLLVEVPPSYLSLAAGSTAGWLSLGGGRYAFPIGLLAVNTTKTVTFKALAAASTPSGTSANFKVTISDNGSQGADLYSANNVASIATLINKLTTTRFT
jgi:uncharacterized repeat protein (TIGR01451 family)